MKRLIAVFILALPALAQQQGHLSLSGTVINGKTGEPLRRAMVTVTRIAPLREEIQQQGVNVERIQRFSRSAFTDSGGLFRFTGLPAGQYSVVARRPEFTLNSSAGRPVMPLSLSSSTENYSVKLSPLGVLTGTITDQDGLPLRGVSVIALSTRIQDGRRQVISDRSVTTDDRGVFRFWSLETGRYYVKAAGFGGGTVQFLGNTPPTLGDESFAPVYFGGADTLGSATALEIGPGTELRADLSLTMESAFGVSGLITNFDPRHEIKFELLTGAEDVSAARVAVNGDTGRFVITSVVPGSYLLRAMQDDGTAETPITVRSSGIDGVTMALAPPVDIHVAMQFTNKPHTTQPDTAQPDDEPAEPGICNAVLRPLGRPGDQRYLFSKPLDTPGTGSVISGVSPGHYSIAIQCFGAYARAATSGTQDLGADPIVTVPPGVSPAPIEIVATYGGGRIDGKLKSDAAFGSGNVTILLVPQFSSPAGPQVIQAFPDAGNPNQFQFQFAGLAPGRYSAWAFAGPGIEYRNPEFLRTLPGGVVVQVDENGAQELTLTGVVR